MQQASSPQIAEPVDVQSESILERTQPPRGSTQREQPCPQCGYPMSDLKGGRESLCHNCGFKDSCCF